MADMTAERRRTGEAVARLLRRAGFAGVDTTELSGAYLVDFQVQTTEPWESRNVKSSVNVTVDGGYGDVVIRPPGADQGREAQVRRAAEAAARAAGPGWGYYLKAPEFAPDQRAPHVMRSYSEPAVPPRQLVDEITSAVAAYRRAMSGGPGSDFMF